MLADRPFNYADYLNEIEENKALFEPLIEIISQIELITFDAKDQGATVGIKGEWGTGKTSVLKAIEEYFSNCYGCPVLFFEAWKYQDEQLPILPLFSKLKEISKEEHGKTIGNFVKHMLYLGSDIALKILTSQFLGKSEGIKEIMDSIGKLGEDQLEGYSTFDKIFKELKDVVKKIVEEFPEAEERDERWEKLQSKINERIKERPLKSLFILIDDLDRLLPDKAIKLLEAIRFYFSLPNTVVIMGINDKILSKALEKYYKITSGKEFMEKLFNLSIELPYCRFDPGIHKVHFKDVLKRLNQKEFPDSFDEMLHSLDPLPHRKWIRIANKTEAFLINGIDPDFALFRAIFEECFPEAEIFLREFPMVWENFLEFYRKPDEKLKRIKEEVDDKVKKDKTVFNYPEQNFNRLLDVLETKKKKVEL